MLADLNPRFVGAGGEGITRDGKPVPLRSGVGVSFDCPCGRGCVRVYVAFANPLDGGEPCVSPGEPTWQRTGDRLEDLSLSPSIQRHQIPGDPDAYCAWHGFVTNGEVLTCV